jgi:hypothetical protein
MANDPFSVYEGIIRPVIALALLVSLYTYMPSGAPSLENVLLWAIVCSIISGGLWAGLVYLSQKRIIPVLRQSTGLFGGNGKEPDGFESLIWTVIVFGPLIIAAIRLTSQQRADHPISAFLGYLVGTAVGASIFYGCRIRDRFLKRQYSYFKQETWLVFWWAVLLAILGFAGYQIGLVVHGGPDALNVKLLLTQIIIMVVPLWSLVTLFVALIPGEKHENVRGLWAGASLALWSLAALVTEPSDVWSWLKHLIPFQG